MLGFCEWRKIGRPGQNYVDRWCLLPKNKWLNLYVNVYQGPDGGIPHNHPFDFIAMVVRGGGEELRFRTDRMGRLVRGHEPLIRFIPRLYRAETIHTISAIHPVKKMVTVMIHGPRRRRWGFLPNIERAETYRCPSVTDMLVLWHTSWKDTIFPKRGGE